MDEYLPFNKREFMDKLMNIMECVKENCKEGDYLHISGECKDIMDMYDIVESELDDFMSRNEMLEEERSSLRITKWNLLRNVIYLEQLNTKYIYKYEDKLKLLKIKYEGEQGEQGLLLIKVVK